MTVKLLVDELVGKTVQAASVVERQNGDAELVLRFADGSTAIVSAWKREGHTLEMNVDLTPNDHPTHGGSARREM
jgi:hypothetical protein